MTTITLKVNGQSVTRDVEPRTLLVQFIRENLQLTGTHVGCDTAQCGARTVHVNGRAIKSCNTLAVQHHGAEITTIEVWWQTDCKSGNRPESAKNGRSVVASTRP